MRPQNRILVLGPASQLAKTQLVKWVRSGTPPDSGQGGAPPVAASGLAADVVVPWRISNKYYSADVEFWIPGQGPGSLDAAQWSEIGNSVVESVGGLIYVVDATALPPSSDSLSDSPSNSYGSHSTATLIRELQTAWAPALDAGLSPEVKLCVAYVPRHAPIPRGLGPVLSDMDECCCTNGFELVDFTGELDLGEDYALAKAPGPASAPERAAARVREALEANLWDDMVSVPPRPRQPALPPSDAMDLGGMAGIRHSDPRHPEVLSSPIVPTFPSSTVKHRSGPNHHDPSSPSLPQPPAPLSSSPASSSSSLGEFPYPDFLDDADCCEATLEEQDRFFQGALDALREVRQKNKSLASQGCVAGPL